MVRFLVEFSTGRPTYGCFNNLHDRPLFKNTYPSGENPLAHVAGNPQYFKHHSVQEIELNQKKERIEEPAQLILVVRDPVECIARHIGYLWTEAKVRSHGTQYWNNVLYFQKFQGDKHLVSYEKLLDPLYKIEEVERLLDFVNGDPRWSKKLIDDLDRYLNLCRNGTGRSWKGSVSGDRKNYHAEQVEELPKFRKIIAATARELTSGPIDPN